MADFVELGAEGVDKLVDKYFDDTYDRVDNWNQNRRNKKHPERARQQDRAAQGQATAKERIVYDENIAPSAVASGTGRARKQKNRLPSPESDDRYPRQTTYRQTTATRPRDSSLDRQSEQSEQVIRAYELERDDPRVKAETVLSKRDLRQLDRDNKMSRANGYAPSGNGRARSENRGGRYYDDDEDSDYDERSGRRYRNTGRGYDDGYDDDDRRYDREIITTEKYRGVSRDLCPYAADTEHHADWTSYSLQEITTQSRPATASLEATMALAQVPPVVP